MKRTFGEHATSKPKGMFREVHWPSMATMDQWTGDGRRLQSKGGGVRDLPRQFAFQFKSLPGHLEAVPVGIVDEITLDDNGNIEGWGWLADDPDGNGQRAAFAIETGMQAHNSIDLAEAKVEIDIDWDSMEIKVDFVEWAIGRTTGVAMPAFANADIELTEEMVASITSDEPLVISAPTMIELHSNVPELTASAATTVPWADFHIPEADEPHKVTIDAEGRVYGHLALWDEPHRGHAQNGVWKFVPRPADDYRHYNHPGVLTENGMVGTGPIMLIGGHPKQSMRGKSQAEIQDAYGNVENTWADVRVSAGTHGPWVSGRLCPGLSDDQIYRARASHVSGHWIDDELMAIVSCNVPGFRPGAGFAAVEDGRIVELVASFPEPPAESVAIPGTMTFTSGGLTFTQSTVTNIDIETFPVVDWSKAAQGFIHLDQGALETGILPPDDDTDIKARALALEMLADDDDD